MKAYHTLQKALKKWHASPVEVLRQRQKEYFTTPEKGLKNMRSRRQSTIEGHAPVLRHLTCRA